MTPELADKIMTRIIARVEADGGVLHKSSGIEEIIGTCAVAEAEGEIIDVITYDEQKGQWIHRDGTPLDMGDDRVEPPATYTDHDHDRVKVGGDWVGQVEIDHFLSPTGWVKTITNHSNHDIRHGDTIVQAGCSITRES